MAVVCGTAAATVVWCRWIVVSWCLAVVSWCIIRAIRWRYRIAASSVRILVQGSDVGGVVGHKGSLGVAVQSTAGCDCVEGVGRFARVGECRIKPMAGLSIHCSWRLLFVLLCP